MHCFPIGRTGAVKRRKTMKRTYGFYKGCLVRDGFKTMFVVYASSSEHAVKKALHSVREELAGAKLQEIEGPYYSTQL